MRWLPIALLLSGCSALCPDGYEETYVCFDISFPIP